MSTMTGGTAPLERYVVLSNLVSKTFDADVVLFSGGIDHDNADELIRIAKRSDRKENIYLLMTTRGGLPDAAYRMARTLQRYYKRITLYVHGRCKSAGTLVAVGAHEIILSDFGELGPLDVQLGKQDELFENQSGLNITQALSSLNTRVIEFFRTSLLDSRAGVRMSTRLSAEIATKLAIGAYEPIFGQVDPVQLGSIERAIQIASVYGTRLAEISKNLHPEAIDKLVSSYPSHSFVIDLEEAKRLFKSVRQPTDTEEELGECISFVTRDENDRPFINRLNSISDEQPDQQQNEPEQGSAGVREGGKPGNPPDDQIVQHSP